MLKELIRNKFFIYVIFFLSLGILLLIEAVTLRFDHLWQMNSDKTLLSRTILFTYENFNSELRDAESRQRSYLLTGDTTYLQNLHASQTKINAALNELAILAQGDSIHESHLDLIRDLVRLRFDRLNEGVAIRYEYGLQAAVDFVKNNQGRTLMDQLSREVYKQEIRERRRLQTRTAYLNTLSRQVYIIQIAGSLISISLLLWAFWLLRSQMRARKEAMDALENANLTLEQRVQERTNELQEATQELNAANEELIAGNEELATINDAQHDLLNELSETQQRLNLALEASRMGVWEWNIRDNSIQWSGNLEAIHGLQPGDFRNVYGANLEGFRKLVHPDDRQLLTTVISQALQEKKEYKLEFRICWPDGSVHWMLGKGMGFYDESDNPARMIGIGLDITERKESEEKLRQSEAKLRRLFEAELIGVIYWHKQGGITDANDYFLQMVGYSREELQQGKVDWMHMTPPEYKQLDEKAFQQMDERGICDPFEKEYIRKDGSRLPILLGVAYFEGHTDQGVAYILDMTERRKAVELLQKSENLLQETFEYSPDALFLVNTSGMLIERYNQQAVQLFGYNDQQELIGTQLQGLQKRDFTPAETEAILQKLHTKKFWSAEVEYLSKHGWSFWGNVAITLFSVDNKDYYLIRIRDITERKLYEEALLKNKQKLQEEQTKTRQALSIIAKDNARKTRELKEARDLQISMLPAHPPAMPNLDIAMYMKTSAEVGGDYYDYKQEADGTLTFVIGDVTGHGLKAGIVVATVKSYFQTLVGSCEAVELLHRISEGIQNLQIRAMYMGLTVIRIKGNQAVIASSGMPPLYIYRQQSRELQRIVLKGLFLGSTLGLPYQQTTVELQSGDTLLAMSDGLPEFFNHQREMLDYGRIEECFCQSAHLPVNDIITQLLNLTEEWAPGKSNEDDITLVVMQVK